MSRMAIAALGLLLGGTSPLRAQDAAEDRALVYLRAEIASWNRENHCFSCHNDGLAARTLLLGGGANAEAMRATLGFLAKPESWGTNGADSAFSDKRLARLQFASALSESVVAGAILERSTLIKAADLVAKDQGPEGSWPIDDASPVGSPATLGPPLATAMAVDMLRRADPDRFRDEIAGAETWVRSRPVRNVLDACSALMVLRSDDDRPRIDRSLAFLKESQNSDGGWGPFPRSPSEPFDTALALIAVGGVAPTESGREMTRRGRLHLIATQEADGGWPGTTRPAGGDSYAQRVSTSAWAAMALIVTRKGELRAGPP